MVDEYFRQPEISYFNCYYRGDLTRWQAETEDEKRAFAELTDLKNRVALKNWYLKLSSINPGAEVFRQILQRAINEELPLAKK